MKHVHNGGAGTLGSLPRAAILEVENADEHRKDDEGKNYE
jgi:hypothetical protein